jgi:hypothetical protein
MELPNARLHLLETSDTPAASRRSFLQLASLAGAVAVTSSAAFAQEDHDHDDDDRGLTKGDRSILIAAEIAEALAVTTYTNIINVAPLFPKLASDDQEYLLAARQEEMSHYLLEQSVTGQPSPFTTFFYPPQMFSDAQTTLNVLVTLEEPSLPPIWSAFGDSAMPICASRPP